MRAVALNLALAFLLVKKRSEQQGRQERRNSHEGQVRRPNLRRYYRHRLRDVRPGDFTFHTLLLRITPKGVEKIPLDSLVSQIQWIDEGPVLTGNLSVKRAEPLHPLPIRDRDRVRLFVHWNGRWYRLWEMVVDGDPVPQLETAEESVALTDDLDALKRNKREWEFKKSKKKPKGWRADQIAREVCRREGVKPGRIAKGTVYIEKLKLDGSGLEVIRRAYAREKKKTERKFVTRLRDGKLDVLPLRRNRVLFEIKGILRGGSLEGRRKKGRPATVIEAKGTIDGKKVEERVFRRGPLRRFGLSREEKSYGRVKSKAELREEAMRDLAEELKVTRTATLEIPGIPFIERGDTVRWINDERGWSGPAKGTRNREFAYVRGITHTVSAGDYTSSVTLAQVDPYLADARRRAEAERDEKNRKREKKNE
jgi:hypothetical protein